MRLLDITSKPLGIQCLVALTLLGFMHFAFSFLTLEREVMTAAEVQSSAGSFKGESRKKLKSVRTWVPVAVLRAIGLVIPCVVLTGRSHRAADSNYIARNLCRLEPAEFPILEAVFFPFDRFPV